MQRSENLIREDWLNSDCKTLEGFLTLLNDQIEGAKLLVSDGLASLEATQGDREAAG